MQKSAEYDGGNERSFNALQRMTTTRPKVRELRASHAPLPTWWNLCRALLFRAPSDEDLASPWRKEGETAGWLSRSAWSFALIALWRQRRAPSMRVRAWIPDYFCNTSLAALRETGVELIFYPLTEQMAPDFGACRMLATATPPDLFVLVHYFGQPSSAVPACDFCERHAAWLIEDAAHVLHPVRGVGGFGDFVLYSPHKHLPIPDGALLVVRPNGPGRLTAEGLGSFGAPKTWPAQLLEQRRQRATLPLKTNSVRSGVWLIKRILQKLEIRNPRSSTPPFAERLDGKDRPTLINPRMSGVSKRLGAELFRKLRVVACRRQRNQRLADYLLLSGGRFCKSVVSAARPVQNEWTPYLATYRVDQAMAETVFGEWECLGLPVTTWPDLPPEVIENREAHAIAWHLRHSRIYLPVHEKMSALALSKIHVSQNHSTEAGLRLVWDHAGQAQWDDWIAQSGRSNLLQTWAYGEAKAAQQRWKVRRGVFYRDHEPIALVQMLEKRAAGLIAVARINRGPLCLRVLSASELRAIWCRLARLGSLWRGRALSVAPELAGSGASLALMDDLGFRLFSPQAWQSAWVDLGVELEVLRRGLDGKWRNMLTASEKSGLKLEISHDDSEFDWLMERYKTHMVSRDFVGPSIALLQTLRKHLRKKDPLIVLRALGDGEPVAGICVARHGAASTYFVGWNGDKGRRLKANHFLLWQAIVCLKEQKVRWFDLGGIDEEHIPGVAAFKLGLNGHRYLLAGEYWKW